MAKRVTVVVSQGQSAHPAKRDLEENLVAALLMQPGIDVVVVPNLYDLTPDGTGILALQGIGGPMVVASWLFERAARWVLDRNSIRGQAGVTLIKPPDEEDFDEDESELQESQAEEESKPRVVDSRPTPNRKIYCLDLRIHITASPYVEEIQRIVAELNTQVVELTGWLGGEAKPEALQRFLKPTNDTALGGAPSASPVTSHEPSAARAFSGNGETSGNGNGRPAAAGSKSADHSAPQAGDAPPANLMRIEEEPDRRWYPVIDYARCTNCMECIDFCLFGVYGVDRIETILVEQPDNCRKGCPACSRVCPENAIIFPQHKTPAIAGADVKDAGGLKIDLSRLFGAPENADEALAVAARERDEQLLLAGRDAVGLTVGIPKRQSNRPTEPKDELDNLLDALDELDL